MQKQLSIEVGSADLEVQDDLVAVVCRKKLAHVSTGVTAQWVKAAIGVDIDYDRYGGSMGLQRRSTMVMRVYPARHESPVSH